MSGQRASNPPPIYFTYFQVHCTAFCSAGFSPDLFRVVLLYSTFNSPFLPYFFDVVLKMQQKPQNPFDLLMSTNSSLLAAVLSASLFLKTLLQLTKQNIPLPIFVYNCTTYVGMCIHYTRY